MGKVEEVVEQTDEQKMADIETLIINEGVLVPATDLVHYMIRNESYMRLINSEEFKASGISLEEVLDDEFIQAEYAKAQETAKLTRFATEAIIPKLQEVIKEKSEEETDD